MKKKPRCRKRTVLFAFAMILVFSLLISVYTLATESSEEPEETDFRGSALLKSEGNQLYKGVKLTAEIYRATQQNLADLRIFASNGKPVPYFIHSLSSQVTAIQQSYNLTLLNSFRKNDYFYYDYMVKALKNEDILATSIAVTTRNTGFAKQVELWGSYDNQHWEKIKDEILYRVEGKEQLEIPLGTPAKKYTHYRFKIANNLEMLSFTSVTLHYNDIILTKERFTDTFSPQYTVEEKEQKTLITLSGLKNLKIESITLGTDSIFKRRVSLMEQDDPGNTNDPREPYEVNAKMLYNLIFQETIYRDLTLPLDAFRAGKDTAVLVIENKDDQPIKIDHVIVKYYADEVIFNGAGSDEFTLRFGNKELIAPPGYDVVNYKERILQEGYDLLLLSDVQILSEEAVSDDKPSADFNPQIIFNVVIVAVALLLGTIILLKLKKT